MLLWYLLAFGLAGLVSRFLVGSRTPVIVLLSAGSIALISPLSLLFCLAVAFINFPLLRNCNKKAVLTSFVIFNLLVLFGFHYYENVYKEFSTQKLPALLGMSFLALQYLDFGFKIYFQQEDKPPGLSAFLTTVLYFPKFFSGPVASLPALEKQLELIREENDSCLGLNRILLGLFKKLVLAESIAVSVHSVFDFNDAYPGLTFLIGALLYSLQLYFDFSGYSDIAIGVSTLWGIDLPENFNFPFRQRNWGDFWKSWHSSLTNWLWQYVFNPVYLFFSRKQTNKIFIALFCSFAVFVSMAFFNGIKSGFYLSAGIFAFFYFVEAVFKIKKSAAYGLFIFLIFSIALIYFRCPETSAYAHITQRLFDFSNFIPTNWLSEFFAPLASGGTQHNYFNLTISLGLSGLFLLFEKRIVGIFFQNKINFAAWFALMVLILAWGVFESGERFIYMQF